MHARFDRRSRTNPDGAPSPWGRVSFCAMWLLVAAPLFAAERLVILPFDDFSGSVGAAAKIEMLIAGAAESKGWTVVPAGDVETALESARVRYVDALPAEAREKVLSATNASALLSGAVFTFSEGRDPGVALAARLAGRDGVAVWGEIASLTGEETVEAFGFGRKTDPDAVAADAVSRLMAAFPAAGSVPAPVLPPRRMRRGGPLAFRDAQLPAGAPMRVCILPFDNASPAFWASRVVIDVLAIRLGATNGFEIVDAATLREAALKARVASFRDLDSEAMSRLAAAVGTPLFLRGTIFTWADPVERSGARTPRVEVELSLVDAAAHRVLWSSFHARNGTDYTGFLMRGAVTTTVGLADRVLTEMITAGTQARPGLSASKRNQRKRPEREAKLRAEKAGEQP